MSYFKTLSRRTFLLSSTAALALPSLETFAKEQKNKNFKRLIFFGNGYGFTEDTFYPTKSGKFKDIGLTEGLSELKKHRDDITLIGNLTNLGATDPHGGSKSFLTGANVAGTPGKVFHNSISCDQVAAKALGKDTRHESLVITAGEKNSGHNSPSLSWNAMGKPITGISTPLQLYKTLFNSKSESYQEAVARLNKKRSILDLMNINAKSINKSISKSDQEKLDEYFQSIREVELGLKKKDDWAKIPKPDAPFKLPSEIDGEKAVKLYYDMFTLAFQTDQTRVISCMLPIRALLTSMGIKIDAHSISHYGFSKDRTEASRQRDKKSMELFSYFLNKMKDKKDIEGKSLYDNSIICFGSNLRCGHMLKNLPLILSGGGLDNIRLGESIILPEEDSPLANVWLSILQEAGLNIDKFSHSTGTFKEIYKA